MDTMSIKVQHGHHDTHLGRLIRDLCNEIERLNRKEAIWKLMFSQVVQLKKHDRRRQPRRKAA